MIVCFASVDGGLPVTAAFSFLRLSLWAALSLWLPRAAGPLSSLLTYAVAVLVFACPELRRAVLNTSSGAAHSIFGGLPDQGLAGSLLLEADGVLSEVQKFVR